jgi:hypothetical protein
MRSLLEIGAFVCARVCVCVTQVIDSLTRLMRMVEWVVCSDSARFRFLLPGHPYNEYYLSLLHTTNKAFYQAQLVAPTVAAPATTTTLPLPSLQPIPSSSSLQPTASTATSTLDQSQAAHILTIPPSLPSLPTTTVASESSSSLHQSSHGHVLDIVIQYW